MERKWNGVGGGEYFKMNVMGGIETGRMCNVSQLFFIYIK